MKFDCDTSSGICSTQLPLIDPQTEQYHLTSFEHSLTTEQATARLLLQTTFGPTKETIANYGFASPAEFVKDQMEIPMTEHRAFYRRNTQAETHAAYGVGRPHHPCEKNSRWRKHAMSGEDVHQYLEVSVEGPPYVLRYVSKSLQRDQTCVLTNFIFWTKPCSREQVLLAAPSY